MVWIPGGAFVMGSNRHFPEEAPAHKVWVDGFHMDVSPITNAQFRAFVDDTGYLTLAEGGSNRMHHIAEPALLPRMGSHVFLPSSLSREDGKRPYVWHFLNDANWRHPLGLDSDIHDLDDHPVVHIAYADAQAYARWAGKELPTEAQWEYASGGGTQEEYAWGKEFLPNGVHVANTWQGEFPIENTGEDGYLRTSPVKAYPPNPHGLFDMVGNVWEWTADFWSPRHELPRFNTIRRNPKVTNAVESCLAFGRSGQIPRRVLKGGSHLCDPHYSPRYRPPARRAWGVESRAGDIGFRCIRSAAPQPKDV